MAVLVGMHLPNGDWDNFVLSRLPDPIPGSTDVLGRTLPQSKSFVAFDGLKRDKAERLAKVLRGVPYELRRESFKKLVGGLRLAAASDWTVFNTWNSER